MSPTTTCVACGGSLSPFGQRSNYEYCRCSTCGTIQLTPLPSKQELAEAYAANYAAAEHYEKDPCSCKLSARPYYQSITKVFMNYEIKGTVLDYGAGWGGLCETLIDNGFQCQGVEMSRDMVAYCQSCGLPVQQGDIAALEGQKFKALALCTVFEHLVEHDEWMAQANQMLEQGGLFVTLQPTARFADFMGRVLRLGNLDAPLPRLHQVFCPPWHTVLFSLNGMRILASRHGFDLLEVRPAPQGRERGLMGFAQFCLETINRAGWRLMSDRWPLLTAHTFVFRRVRDVNTDSIQ